MRFLLRWSRLETWQCHLVVTILIVRLNATAGVHTDTIGTTSIDYQNYGPVWQRVFNLPTSGVYAAWVKTGMASNYYDYTHRRWQGETDVFGSLRNAAGNLDVPLNPGPYYRSTFISSWLTRQPRSPVVAVESLPGSGLFSIRTPDSSLAGCQRAPLSFTTEGWLHMLFVDSATGDTLLYSRSTDYGTTWSSPLVISGSHPPCEPTYNIAGSDSSSRIAAVWSVPQNDALYMNMSDDGGTSWSGTRMLPAVPSPIPGARSGRFGAYAIFDTRDRLNLVTQVWNDSNPCPAEIWHWQEGRVPEWSLVHRYAPSSTLAPPEPGEPFAVRPSLALRPLDDRLFAAWMNYDSANYEVQTQLARADIFVSQSLDNGLSWSPPLRITGPDNGSRISPCLASFALDTLVLICVNDQIAGIFENGHGGQTVNTVNVIFVPVADIPAITETDRFTVAGHARSVISRGTAGLRRGRQSRTTVLDVTGQVVPTLGPESSAAARLPAGIYFAVSGNERLRVVIVP